MPNHVINKISLSGSPENIKAVLDAVKSEESLFDFNKIIPMPESLKMDSGSSETRAILVFISAKLALPIEKVKENRFAKLIHNMFDDDFITNEYYRIKQQNLSEKELNDLFEKGVIYCSNYDKYGFTSWYEWCIYNWGTKWNAYEVEISENEVFFQTAWSSPYCIIDAFRELCNKHGVSFTGVYASEDAGSTAGYYDSSVEESAVCPAENCSSDAYKAYVECWGESNCIGFTNGEYEHYDCDSCPNKENC